MACVVYFYVESEFKHNFLLLNVCVCVCVLGGGYWEGERNSLVKGSHNSTHAVSVGAVARATQTVSKA